MRKKNITHKTDKQILVNRQTDIQTRMKTLPTRKHYLRVVMKVSNIAASTLPDKRDFFHIYTVSGKNLSNRSNIVMNVETRQLFCRKSYPGSCPGLITLNESCTCGDGDIE